MDDEYDDDELEEDASSDDTDEEQEEELAQQEAEERAHANWQNLQTVKRKRMQLQKQKIWQAVISVITPLIPYIAIAGLIIVAVMAVAASWDSIISSVSSWFSTDGSSTVTSENGVTGEDFYGIRTIYRDEEQSTADIIEDYVAIIDTVISTIEGDTTINTTIDVEITMPGADYDYTALLTSGTEEAFAGDYATLYALLSDMAKTVYEIDNAGATETFTGSYNLINYASGIKYFGYTDAILSDLRTLVSDYISTYYYTDFSKVDDSKDTATQAEVDDVISSAIISAFSSCLTTRSEKLYIKDYLLSDNEDDNNYRIYGITAEEYVAYIFMPKRSVTFTAFSFAIANVVPDDIAVYIQTESGAVYSVTCDEDGGLIGTDDDTGISTYLFESASSLSISAGVYANIDSNNLTYLSTAKNLYEIATDSTIDYTTYLTTDTEGVLTWKQGGVMTMTEYDDVFGIIEYETYYD